MQLRRRSRASVYGPHRARDAAALAAAGERYKNRGDDSQQRLRQQWQARSFAFYDSLPEIKYAAQFYSRGLSPLKLYAAELDERGVPQETENKDVMAMVDRIQDPGGGRSGILSAYGRLMFLAGEAQMFVSKDPETEMEQWEMLSGDELRVHGSGDSITYSRYKAPSVLPEEFHEASDDDFEPIDDSEAVAYRLWNRHPRYSDLADSTMQGVLDICEELIGLTHAVRARLRSRLASAGILIVNGKITVVPLEAVPDEDIQSDPVLDELVAAATRAIQNPNSSSAVVPVILRVDGEVDVDKVLKHVQLVDPTQLYPETGLRYECVKRLAIGLDMPPEELLGLTDANHWSGWLVNEQTWKAHLQPFAQRFVDDLTAAYLRPSLRKLKVDGWQRFCIAYDATAVINHPDRGKDAKDLHALGAIGDPALREACGFDDDDAQTEDERRVWLGIKVRDGSLAIYGIPSKLGTGGIETEAGQIEQGTGGTTTDAGSASAEASKAPPEQPDSGDPQITPGVVIGAGDARLLGASNILLQRAREIAGARLRAHAKRDPEAAKLLDGVPNSRVAAALGIDRAQALRAPAAFDLIQGVRDELEMAFSMWEVDRSLLGPLGLLIERHAAETLYDEHPAPLPALPPAGGRTR